jgi:hypothetical protein
MPLGEAYGEIGVFGLSVGTFGVNGEGGMRVVKCP